MATLLITDGAGFIGIAVMRFFMANTDWRIINVDKLTFAASLKASGCIDDADRYHLTQVNICNRSALEKLFHQHQSGLFRAW